MPGSDAAPMADGPLPPCRVLYIEDHPLGMAFVEEMLAQFPGVTLLKATTGREGIDKVRREQPDLVLLDMHLPDISGLEVVRALNEVIATGHPRVILLTADTLSMDIIKAMSLGAHEYWIKPVDRARLESALRHAPHGPRTG